MCQDADLYLDYLHDVHFQIRSRPYAKISAFYLICAIGSVPKEKEAAYSENGRTDRINSASSIDHTL